MQPALFDAEVPMRASDDRFEVFWQAWPAARRVDKHKARAAFIRAALSGAEWTQLQRVLPLQVASPQWTEHPRFIPHPTTYLNNRRWTDDPAAYAPAPPTAAELERAHRIRANMRGGCLHDPVCDDWRACVARIVASLRERP